MQLETTGKFGAVNRTGELIIPAQFDELQIAEDGTLLGKKNEHYQRLSNAKFHTHLRTTTNTFHSASMPVITTPQRCQPRLRKKTLWGADRFKRKSSYQTDICFY